MSTCITRAIHLTTFFLSHFRVFMMGILCNSNNDNDDDDDDDDETR